MTLPFVHRSFVAVFAGSDRLDVLTLRYRLGRFVGWRFEREAVASSTNGKREGRSRPDSDRVGSHLRSVHVRHALVDGPTFDEPDLFDVWIASETSRVLLDGAPVDDFVLRVRVIDQSEDRIRCLIAAARKEAVVERASILAAAGIEPVWLGSEAAALLDLAVTFPALARGSSAVVILEEEGAALVRIDDGLPVSWHTLESTPPDSAGLADELLVLQTGAGGSLAGSPLAVVGSGAEAVLDALRNREHAFALVSYEILSPTGNGRRTKLPLSMATPAALALQARTGGGDSLNFLAPEVALKRRLAAERSEAIRLTLGMGGMLAVFLLISTLLLSFLQVQQSRTEDELLLVAGQLAEVEESRAALKELERDVRRAEALVMRRTSMAGLITRIGDEAPDNLWLGELRLENGNERWKMYLEGAALDERYLATYLERLERSPLVRDVRLVLSELRSSAMLLPASTGTERDLVRFEIEMTVPTLAATEGGI